VVLGFAPASGLLAQFPAYNQPEPPTSTNPVGLSPFGPEENSAARAPSFSNPAFQPPPPAAPTALPPQTTVADVRIVGNETVEVDKILQLIRTRKNNPFDPELVEQDTRNLLTKGRFRHVNVTTQDTAHGVLVTFEVFERPTIRYIDFIGDRGISPKALEKETGLRPGDAQNVYAVEEARRKLEELYRRKGYPKIQVTVAEGNRPEDRGVIFMIGEGPRQRIWSVTFTGNDETIIPDGRLKAQIESKPGLFKIFGGTVDHEKIAADIEKLTVYYRGLGYFGARVGRRIEYDEKQKWLTINYVIDEGPRYVVRNVSVVGNAKFPTEQLQAELQLHSGDYFNLDRMNADRYAIQDLYGSQGYIFAKIEADPRFLEEPGELDLVYSVAEGQQFRVGRINVKIAGEFPHTKERVILDRLSIRPGQIVDIREVRNSERRLKYSQLFIVNPTEGDPPRIVILPPDLKDAEELLAGAGNGTQRGQDPETSPPVVDLEIELPASYWWW
jgi:outer membrane protein insertion porin family